MEYGAARRCGWNGFRSKAERRSASNAHGGVRREVRTVPSYPGPDLSQEQLEVARRHKLGKRKEILLTPRVAKAFSSSGRVSGCGLVRMHGFQAYEIPVLRSSRPPVWTAAKAVRAVPAHVDDPPEEARAPRPPDAGVGPPKGVRARLHGRPALLQAPGGCAAGPSVSIPTGAAARCCPAQSPTDPSRTTRVARGRPGFSSSGGPGCCI